MDVDGRPRLVGPLPCTLSLCYPRALGMAPGTPGKREHVTNAFHIERYVLFRQPALTGNGGSIGDVPHVTERTRCIGSGALASRYR